MPSRRTWMLIGAAVALLFIAAQAVPYGHGRTNPSVLAEPMWDSVETRALARRACFDCHSNETEWPLYSRIAPASWLIRHDVDEGRAMLNFSEWNRPQEEAAEAPEKVMEGEMPLRVYTVMHAHARLTAAEREQLARGLARTLGTDAEGTQAGSEHERGGR